jgi:hypothetical protein
VPKSVDANWQKFSKRYLIVHKLFFRSRLQRQILFGSISPNTSPRPFTFSHSPLQVFVASDRKIFNFWCRIGVVVVSEPDEFVFASSTSGTVHLRPDDVIDRNTCGAKEMCGGGKC